MDRFWMLVLRDLRNLPPELRAAALQHARDTPLTTTEAIAVAVSIGAVAMATRRIVGGTAAGPIERFLLGFAMALPLLAATVGLCHVSRLRRGLKEWGMGQRRP